MGREGETGARNALFSRVCVIRAAAQMLIEDLAALRKAAERAGRADKSSTAGKKQLEGAVKQFETGLEAKDPREHQAALRELLDDNHGLRRYAEDAAKVVYGLSRFSDRWGRDERPESGAVLTAVEDCTAILGEVVFHCSLVTVPGEVEEELISLRVGKALDFNESFKEKLPDAARRKRILTNLKHKRIGGWVDVREGLIYRLPRSSTARVLTCIAPFVLALLAATLMYGLPTLDLPGAWHLGGENDEATTRWQLVGAFGLVLLGVVLHLLVENIKQLQTRSVPIVAISDGVYWLNLRWLGLVLTVLWALVVAIGLRVSGVGPNDEGIPLFIAAGYSLDSVAGLVLTRFDSISGPWLRQVNEKLKAPDKAAAQEAEAPATA